MLQVIVQGRGGQGAQTAGTLLAKAFFAAGRYVQSFATYGGARRGTPVSSYLRVSERPIRTRCEIEHADAILCFDASLLEGRLLAAAGADTVVIVNSTAPAREFQTRLPGYRIVPVDGVSIAQRNQLGRIVNSALLGAFACAVGAPDLEVLAEAIAGAAPDSVAKNVAACREGHALMSAQVREAAA
jgi:pyruvate ferredoxin oxidoreductase gamma subunit